MATRNPKLPGRKPGESCTEFQLHKSQLPYFNLKSIFDYTEYRLIRYIEEVEDDQQEITLKKLLDDYKHGKVAIAWKGGKPSWLNVTRESSRI